MTILHIDSSILGQDSSSRALTTAVVEQLAQANSAQVVYRDLTAFDLPHLTLATMPGDHPLSAMAGPLDPAAQAHRDVSQTLLDEFLAADTVVIGAPMYNFGIPSQLKAWLDRLLVPGKTFGYGANGPEGLAGAKRVIVVISRGNVYGPGSDSAAVEHAESHLRAILDFIGITNPEVIVAEGLALGDDVKVTALDAARQRIGNLAA